MSRRNFFAAIMLGVAGFGLNWFKLSLFFNVDFLFGSILTMYALRRFGLATGTMAAALAASCTWLHWHHPWAIVIFTAEAFSVGLLRRYRHLDLILSDTLFWCSGGLLLVWLFYYQLMGVNADSTLMIALKQGVNGLVNTLLAELLFIISRKVTGCTTLPSLRSRFRLVLQIIVLLPAVIMAYGDIHAQFNHQLSLLRENTARMAEVASKAIANWMTEEQHQLHALANVIGDPMHVSPEELQKTIERTHAAHTENYRMGVLGVDHRTLAYSPRRDEKGDSTVGLWLGDRPFIPKLVNNNRPLIIEALMGKVGTPGPRLVLLHPIAPDRDYRGAVFSVIGLEAATSFMQTIIGTRQMNLYLLDEENRVIVSTSNEKDFLKPYSLPEKGRLEPTEDAIRLWVPEVDSSVNHLKFLNKAFYHTEVLVTAESGLRLVVETSLRPALEALGKRTTILLGMLMMLSLVITGLARTISSRMLAPFIALSTITRQLPDQIKQGEQIDWFPAQVQEEHELQNNFQEMETALHHSFAELTTLNHALEIRVA